MRTRPTCVASCSISAPPLYSLANNTLWFSCIIAFSHWDLALSVVLATPAYWFNTCSGCLLRTPCLLPNAIEWPRARLCHSVLPCASRPASALTASSKILPPNSLSSSCLRDEVLFSICLFIMFCVMDFQTRFY